MYLRTCGSFKSTNRKKRMGPQMANPQRVTFAEGPQILVIKSANFRICDLRNLLADRPALIICMVFHCPSDFLFQSVEGDILTKQIKVIYNSHCCKTKLF
jgi:hypothetical protein